jgi:hypothetical protein
LECRERNNNMDWLKAKNIILVMLILLNIFLLINVMSVKDVFKFTGQYQKDAKQALEEAGIVIEGKIPFYGRPLCQMKSYFFLSVSFQTINTTSQ